MNSGVYHFKHLILSFFFAKLITVKLPYKLLTVLVIMEYMPVHSAEFNNASRLNSLQNNAISADRLISLIQDSKRNENNVHSLDLGALNEEASRLTASALAPPLVNDDLLFDEVNSYATLLKEGDEVILFILMNDSGLMPFSLITPIEDLASLGMNIDVSTGDNHLHFHPADQAALFLWPAHHFDSIEMDSFSSEVSGQLWHGKDTITFTDEGEMITGQLSFSFQNDEAALRFLSSHGALSLYFSLGELTDFGILSTTGRLSHNGEDRNASISLGLLRTHALDAFLQFKTETDHCGHHFTGFVTTLPYQKP